MEASLQATYDTVLQRNQGEPEFHQAVREVFESLETLRGRHPEYEAHGILMDAFWTDVRPALAAFREERGRPADPFAAFRASDYEEKVAGERVGGNQMGWGA